MGESTHLVDDLCKALWSVEREYGLLDFEVDGVKIWQYMRMPVYYQVAERTGVFLAPHVRKSGHLSKVTKVCRYLLGALLHNPFFRRARVEQVVIEHPRSVRLAGEEVDIYSHFYVRALQRRGVPYLCLDRADLGSSHRKAYDPARSFIDVFPILVKLAGLFHRARLSNEQRAILLAVSERLSRQLGVPLDLEALLLPAVLKFKVNYRLYRTLFKRLKPKRLVVVVGYAYGDAIQAAKDLGIETLELQHGTFSRYHLGYSYPGVTKVLDYFPDSFMAWGEFWRDVNILPLPRSKFVVKSFCYFNQTRKQYADVKKHAKNIVILSQGALGEKIAERLYAYWDVLKEFNIIYKLHPGELPRWKEYEYLVKLAAFPNVRIVETGHLYSLLAEAQYQIGVFSTALYEGMGFNCVTLLLDLPGVEYMTDLIESQAVILIRKQSDLENALYPGYMRAGHINSVAFFGEEED